MSQAARIGLAVFVAAGFGLQGRAADQDAAAAQAERGGKLYGKHCASCHGDAGQGTKKGPPVVGKDALPKDPRPTQKLRKTQFRTAKDVADFVVANMPGDKPGSLQADEYFAILAFDLKANGVALTQPVDAAVAAGIVLHP
jgi:mono/diheme cytochrome c family protein